MKIKTVKLNIKGMTCESCAAGITELLDIDGVIEREVSFSENAARITYDEDKITPGELKEIIGSAGHYQAEVGGESIIFNGNSQKHLIIVGGGSAAFAAAIKAREYHAKVTMINDGLPIGGTCVNVGCVPSKNLIRAGEALHRANHNPFPGIRSQGELTGFKALIDQKRNLVEQLRREKYIDIVKDMENFRRIRGRATIVSSDSVEVNGEILSGDSILITTGARPYIPDIEGLRNVPYLDNESAFELETLPQSLIILGGRYIALETAQMFSRLGSRVTILQRSSRILPDEAPDLTNALTGYLTDEGLTVITGNRFRRVYEQDGGVTVESVVDGETRKFQAEKLIVAAGRQPNTARMGLEETGIRTVGKGYVEVDEHLRTSIPTIFAAGDVIGGHMFVYTAAYEGNLAAANALSGSQKKRDYTALPWVVFTDPQVAGVGSDEIQARTEDLDFDTAILPLKYVPRAIAARDTRGFIKLIRDKNNRRLIGARILAPEGSELLMEVTMAIKHGITVEEIKDMFHPYLTMGEGIKLAAISFDKKVEELSCCAT